MRACNTFPKAPQMMSPSTTRLSARSSSEAQLRRIRKRNLEAKKKFVGSLLSEVFDFNPTCFTLASWTSQTAPALQIETTAVQLRLRFFHFVSRSNMRTHLVKVCPHGGFDVEGDVIKSNFCPFRGKSRNSFVDGNPELSIWTVSPLRWLFLEPSSTSCFGGDVVKPCLMLRTPLPSPWFEWLGWWWKRWGEARLH